MEALNLALNSLPQAQKQTSQSELPTDETSSTDFLNMVLNSINKNEKISESDAKKIIEKAKNEATKESITQGLGLENLDDSLIGNTNFIQILGLLEALNGGESISKFPNFSDSLAKFLSIEQNVNEIKDAKSLVDLINLSKKFDLGLSKISVTKEDIKTLKEQFTNLGKSGFFDLKEMNLNEITKKKIQTAIQTTKKDEPAHLSKLLQNVSTNLAQKTETKTKSKEQTQEIQTETKTKPTNSKEVNLESLLKTSQKSDEKESLKQVLQSKPEDINQAQPSSKQAPTKNKKEVSVDDYLASITQKALKEQVNEPTKFDIKSLNLETKELKSDAQTSQSNEQNGSQNEQQNNANSLVKDIVANAKLQVKNNQVKQTFESFASNLQEKISEYKPPITRFHLTLNPTNLGEVEVTLINRGNNLHINFNSNNQTMQLFLQNQAEFKNSLVNMGFTELEMNFSDQNGSNKEQNGNTKFKNYNADFEDTLNGGEEENIVLEVVIPKYF
ncbi:flagellar hook-length control protein [Campylobacter iguaniorum]|uniref:flagellar hook-length control protein FliK n=1 Tax=Campylobacter iguaniorum TaxID=1244531 RepID=UPI00073A43F1|nr:flagellar hook-length control protein FliK [Campylobacter iguaniorum]ALV23630.1 flagellar hook-length control protein [Campylobacter iguaniorum]